jgi:extradiol dioxygenase family protein
MSAQAPRFHLSLRVRPERLAEVVSFYAALFGTPPRKRHADHVQFDLQDPPLNLTFVPGRAARTGEVDHLGLQVFSEATLSSARSRLAAAGLALREEPQVECCYARQDKFWLTDPEGREVEVFHKLADIETHGRAAPALAPAQAESACCPTECCAGE